MDSRLCGNDKFITLRVAPHKDIVLLGSSTPPGMTKKFRKIMRFCQRNGGRARKITKKLEFSPAKNRDGRIIVQTTFGLFVSSKIKVKSVKLRNPPPADDFLVKREADKRVLSF